MQTKSGEPTSALYGLCVLLLKLLREESPAAIAFARDLPAPTFRHEIHAEYKSGRPPVPDALRTQWKRLGEILAALDVPVHAHAGFEADDVLASLAKRLGATDDVLVVSGDRDLFQTIGPRVRVLFLGARGQKPTKVGEAEIRARYGLAPSALPSFFALVGEQADNLEGVAGVGAKTATKLVAEHGSIASLVSNLERVAAPKLRDALESAKDRILQNESLARLRDDLPLAQPLAGPVTEDAIDALGEVFATLEFTSLVARLAKIKSGRTH